MAAAQPAEPTAWIAVSLLGRRRPAPGSRPAAGAAARAATGRGRRVDRRAAGLRGRVAELEAAAAGPPGTWTMYSPPRYGAVRQVRVGAAEPHRVAAFWAAVTGGSVERAGVLGRLVDWALAAQGGVHPELLVSTREPAGQLTLTVEVGDLAAKVRWLRDLGGTVLQETAGAALVEDPEGTRGLLVEQRADPPGGRLRRPSLRP